MAREDQSPFWERFFPKTPRYSQKYLQLGNQVWEEDGDINDFYPSDQVKEMSKNRLQDLDVIMCKQLFSTTGVGNGKL